MRIPFATPLKSRDGTLAKDAKVLNGIVEAREGDTPKVRKRPGLLDLGLVRAGAAQLLCYWNGKVRTVIGDYIGAGYVGEYARTEAVWNSADKAATVTLSGSDLTVSVVGEGSVRSTTSVTSGKWYWEYSQTSLSNLAVVGLANSTMSLTVTFPGYDNNSIGLLIYGGAVNAKVYKNNVQLADTGVKVSNGDVVGVLLDKDAGTLKFYKNNTLIYSGSTLPTGALYAVAGTQAAASFSGTANFGASSFTYTPAGVVSTNISPTDAGLQFSAQDNGANSPESFLMVKNASQAWTIDTADTVTQITDTDYPGTYAVALTSLTRSGTTATATTSVDTNFQAGSTVVIAGATPTDYNGSQTVLSVTRSGATIPAPDPVAITITRSSTTATATSTNGPHGFTNGQSVTIAGSDQSEYNGAKTITWISATQFSFTVTVIASAPVTPATGSPAFSRVIFADVSIVNYSMSLSVPSPLIGGDYQNFRAVALSGTHGMSNGSTAQMFFNGALITITASNVTASTFEFSISGWASPASGAYYLQYVSPAAISSITRSGRTATVTTGTAHGFLSRNRIYITGATQGQYNAFDRLITVTGASTFTFDISGNVTDESPATPATGAITAQGGASIQGSSFTFAIGGSVTTPATGTITATGGRNTVPGIAYINGYFVVMDIYGVVYNSGLDNPEQWNALEYQSALNEPGAGKAIAKSGNYVAAFKEWSTEFFYDAKNAVGSPLSPVENGFTLIGCASGDSVANVDGALMWIAQSKKHKGRSVYVMRGIEQAKVSTPDVERILNADSLSTVRAWGAKIDGHPCYVLSLVGSDITLVYDALSGDWVEWSTLTIGSGVSVSTITRSGTTATVGCAAVHGLSDGDAVTISGANEAEYNGIFQISYVSPTAFKIEVEVTEVSISSLTRSGTTATADTATAHGLVSGQKVTVSGADQADYNITATATVSDTDTFTYAVANSPTTPATGTIIVTTPGESGSGTILVYPYMETYFKNTHYTAANGVDVVLHVSDGHLYEIDPDEERDDGVPINYFVRTSRLDGGSSEIKPMPRITVIGDSASDTAMVRWSDDDSATFSAYRRVTLSDDEPQIRRCGSFRRRSIELRHVGNTSPSLEAFEIGG